MYYTKIVVHQHQFFGPFPISYDKEMQEALFDIMSAVAPR
jgi:hypothetical protein